MLVMEQSETPFTGFRNLPGKVHFPSLVAFRSLMKLHETLGGSYGLS